MTKRDCEITFAAIADVATMGDWSARELLRELQALAVNAERCLRRERESREAREATT